MAGNFMEEGTQLCNGHSACRSVFSISLSTAALHLSGGGSMFDKTGRGQWCGAQGPNDDAQCQYFHLATVCTFDSFVKTDG